jgi:hypothetical protein
MFKIKMNSIVLISAILLMLLLFGYLGIFGNDPKTIYLILYPNRRI